MAFISAATSRPVSYGPTGTETPLDHDDNGQRRLKDDTEYTYDGAGRLVEVWDGTELVNESFYDEGGARVAKREAVGTGTARRHYYRTFEVRGEELVRYYFLGSRRVAMDVVDSPSSLNLGSDASAGLKGTERLTVLAAGLNAAQATAGTLAVIGVLMFLAAGTGRRVAVLVVVLLVSSTLPLPAVLDGGLLGRLIGPRSAHATAEASLRYFHTDHLGSVRLLTDCNGGMTERIVYGAYGNERGIYDGNGNSLSAPSTTRTFTGHEREGSSGLLYMGARFYDPDMGTFLTFDPAEQFASPYTYVGHSPTNAVDPDGRFGVVEFTFIAIALAATATFVDALVKTGDFGTALSAGVTSAVISSAAFVPQAMALQAVVSLAGTVELAEAAEMVINVASTGYQGYSAINNIENGNIASAIAGIGLLVWGFQVRRAALDRSSSVSEPAAAGLGEVASSFRVAIDVARTGETVAAGSTEYASIREGIEHIANPWVRGRLLTKLNAGGFSTFDARWSDADGVTIGSRIYLSKATIADSVEFRAFVSSHEYFHVLENRLLNGILVHGRPPDAYADYFGARVVPLAAVASYGGRPEPFFRDIVAGRYDAEIRAMFGGDAVP